MHIFQFKRKASFMQCKAICTLCNAKTKMHILQCKNPYTQYVMQKPNQHSAMAGLLCGSALEHLCPRVSANHCALPHLLIFIIQNPCCTLCNAKPRCTCKPWCSSLPPHFHHTKSLMHIMQCKTKMHMQTIVLFLTSPFSSLLSSPVSVLSSSSLFLSL